MKKLIALIPVLFVFYCAKSQSYTVPRLLPSKDSRFVENTGVAGASYLFDSLVMFRNMADTQMKPLYPALAYIQDFAGDSTFWVWDMVRWKKLTSSGGGGGGTGHQLVLAPIGSTPNANAMTLTDDSVLNVQPYSRDFGGITTASNTPQYAQGQKGWFSATDTISTYYTTRLRSNLDSSGIQTWYLNGGAGEVGKLSFTTPVNHPGIAAWNTLNTGRSQWRQYKDTGGVSMGSLSTGGVPNNAFVLLNNGHTFITGHVDAIVSGNEYNVTDNGYLLQVEGTSYLEDKLYLGTVADGLTSDSILVIHNTEVKKVASGSLGAGTVTSVAATAASGMTVTGSPITTSGTLAFAWTGAVQGDLPFFSAANTVSFLNKSTTANQYLKNSGTSNNPAWATIAASDIGSGAALTKTDDANVTLTLGGSPTTSLLAATSLTLGWTGQLAVTRGGTGQSSYTDGQLLIGNTSGNTLTKATLTAGSGISVTNGNGSITIASTGTSGTDTVNVSNVLSFGADSTGVSDATSAFNNAINESRLNGKMRVYAPHGTYRVTVSALKAGSQTNKQGIQMLDNIELFGDGIGKTIIVAAGNTTGDTTNTNWYPVINGIQSVSNVKVHDVEINGNKDSMAIYNSNPYVNPRGHADTTTRQSVQGILFRVGNNNQVYDVYSHNCQGYGVEMYDITRAVVRNSKFSENGNGGIGYVGGFSVTLPINGTISDNLVTHNRSDNISLVSCSYVNVTGNELSWADTSSAATNWFAGIFIDRATDIHITHNYVHDNSAYGIDLGGGDSAQTKNNVIEFNNIYQNGNGGIAILSNAIINNNVIHDNGKTSTGIVDSHSPYNPAAVCVNNSTNLTITNNLAYDSVSGTQTYFTKKYGGTPTASWGVKRSVITNNVIKSGVADTAHAYNGNAGDNSIIYNIITTRTTIIPPASDSMVLGLVNKVPQWIPRSSGSGTSITATQIGYGDGSNLLTSDANFTRSSTAVTISDNDIQSASTTALSLTNTQVATSLLHQYSPRLNFHGNEWKTTATAASQPIDGYMWLKGVQGTTNPIADLTIGSYTNSFTNGATLEIGSNGVSLFATAGSATTLYVNGAIGIGNVASISTGQQTTSVLSLGTQIGSTLTSLISSSAGLTSTANSSISGINMNPQIGATAPHTSSSWYGGNFSMQANGSTNYTTAPAILSGLKGSASYGNNGTAVVFPLGIGVQGDVNLRTGATKNLTTGYGLYATLSSADATPAGKVVYYAGLRVDSIDQRMTFSKPFGLDVRGTNGYSFIANSTLIGNYHSSGNDTATSTLEVNGSFATAVTSTAVDYTVTGSDATVIETASGKTVTLPTAVGITGRIYRVVYTGGSGTATIATTSSQTFTNITSAPTSLTLSAPAAGTITSYSLQSDGANWIVISKIKNE